MLFIYLWLLQRLYCSFEMQNAKASIWALGARYKINEDRLSVAKSLWISTVFPISKLNSIKLKNNSAQKTFALFVFLLTIQRPNPKIGAIHFLIP